MKPTTISRITLLLLLALLTAAEALGAGNKDRSRYDALFMEAMMEREQGNNTAAFELLRHCAAIDPEAPEVYYFMAQYYAMMKDKARMLACFKKASLLAPGNATYMETLAQAYIDNNQNDEAIATFEKLVGEDPNRDDILETLAQLYQQKDDYAGTISALDRLEKLDGKSERLSYAKSSIYTRQGNHRAAIAEMKQLADQYPNDLNYRGMYGDVLLMNGEEQKARDIYRSILREEPDNNHAQLSLRAYYQQTGNRQEADSITLQLLLNRNTADETRIGLMRQMVDESEENGGDSTQVLRYFRRLMQMPQKSGDIAFLYATYMYLKKMPADSIKPVLRQVLELSPDNAAARLQLVGYAWQEEAYDSVVSLCEPARMYNPDNVTFSYFEGMALFNKKQTDKALEVFKRGTATAGPKSEPEIMANCYAFMAEIYVKKHWMKEAFAAYDSSLQWKPDDPLTLNNYAYFLCLTGRQLDKAEQMSQKAVKAEPDNANSLDTYAWILFLQQRYAEAKIYIDQALRHDSDSTDTVLEHAGDIYARNGLTDEAVSLWQKAAQKDPDNRLLARKIKLRKYIKQK